MHITFNQCFG